MDPGIDRIPLEIITWKVLGILCVVFHIYKFYRRGVGMRIKHINTLTSIEEWISFSLHSIF
jgi:hypothetical protein